jgi:hypothetical protein
VRQQVEFLGDANSLAVRPLGANFKLPQHGFPFQALR